MFALITPIVAGMQLVAWSAVLLFGVQFGQWSFVDIAIAVVVVAGVVGVVYVVLRTLGISVPSYVQHLFWIVVLVCLAIMAIRIIASM